MVQGGSLTQAARIYAHPSRSIVSVLNCCKRISQCTATFVHAECPTENAGARFVEMATWSEQRLVRQARNAI